MLLGEVVRLSQVIGQIVEFDLFSSGNQLPLSFPDRDVLSGFPIKTLMRGLGLP